MDRSGIIMVGNIPAVHGQLNREKCGSLSPSAPENRSHETGSTVSSHVSLPILRTQGESGTNSSSRDSSRFPQRTASGILYCQPPSGQCRVYRAMHLRTDGVHCRESPLAQGQ